MSEQVTEAVNPGQAIYDALSDEAKAAVDALPDSVFEGSEGLHAAQRIARDIQMCAEQSATIWSIISDPAGGKEFVALNVAMTNMVSCVPGDFRLVLRISEQATDELKKFVEANATYRSYSDGDMVQVGTDRLEQKQFPEFVIQAHEKELRIQAGLGWKRNQRANWHRDDWRVKLALITGMELPAPAYVSDERVGLRMDIAESGSALHEAELQESTGTSDVTVKGAASTVNVPHVLNGGFASAGLTYSDSQIASFYTALQTKGFVILNGISGTGKSKIALRFAGMLPTTRSRPSRVVDVEFVRPIEPYMKKYNLFVVPKELAGQYRAPEPGAGYAAKIEIDGVAGTGRLQNPKNLKTGDGWSVRLSWKGELRDQFRSMDADAIRVRMRLRPDGTVEYAEIAPELDGLEPTDDIETIETEPDERGNCLFLPVRPDWRDGKALIGYHNPLTGEYVRTDFLDFVIAAGDDHRAGNRNAFFVILDEMNLAHVEYYFADVLSVIESGRDDEGWTVEGIPLAVGEEDSDLPDVLKLPPNLYIVGTVNMDETTHPFSPKVLDRAFTIELTDVDFSGYPPAPVDGDAALDDDERQALLRAFTQDGRYPRIDKDDIREVVERHGRFRDDLHHLNTSLKRYRMHFGYRVFDETMQFVHNAERNELFSADEAFDHAVLMKVLPKFNGSRARLERPLIELILWSRQHVPATEDEAREVVTELENLLLAGKGFDALVRDSDDWRYPATGKRAALMMQDLYTDGFASFG